MGEGSYVFWHGTREQGLKVLRESGFRPRDPDEAAEAIADAFDLDAEYVLVAEGLVDIRQAGCEAAGRMALAEDIGLAERYAIDGAEAVGELLQHAADLHSIRGRTDASKLVQAYLESEGRPVLIEFGFTAEELAALGYRRQEMAQLHPRHRELIADWSKIRSNIVGVRFHTKAGGWGELEPF